MVPGALFPAGDPPVGGAAGGTGASAVCQTICRWHGSASTIGSSAPRIAVFGSDSGTMASRTLPSALIMAPEDAPTIRELPW